MTGVDSIRFLARRPGPRLADGLVTHGARQSLDLRLAERQWHNYVDVLQEIGWSIIEVPSADDCPDAVFVEDAVVMFEGTAIVTSPGAPTRRSEVDGVT
ncbi:MAG: N(G),N(G)-dimethylarginine dimethylaminohydrolase, partial [Ilumatobacteraceae bacterium]